MRKIYISFLALFVSICSIAQITLPLNFEGAGPYTWTNFGETIVPPSPGATTTVVNNPQSGGINTSVKVGQTIKGPGGEPYAGSFIQIASDINLTTLKYFRMKVYSKAPGLQVLMKLENAANGGLNSGDVFATTTLNNAWEDLSFDFTGINLANTYQRIVIIFRLGFVGDGTANFTFHFDDIRQEAAPAGTLDKPTLPVTFESPTVNYTFVDFDGGSSSIIANPQKSGINTSNTVARLVKGSPGVPSGIYAGSKLPMASTIDFSPTQIFRMKVFSPRIGAKVRLKLEGGASFESSDVTLSKANEWEDLSFTMNPPINNTNNQIVIFFDITTAREGGPNNTFLVDDIRVEASGGGGGGLTQMKVPVTFDDPTVAYNLIGFGGAEAATVETDPTNPANKVGKVIKSATAELWAGATLTAIGGAGFSEKLPLTVGNTFMNVRVWSPDAGIKVRLKVEDSNDGGKSVETEATTTVAGGWQNLVFNFANEAAGTAAINYAFNYNKASIFFNFGVTGVAAGGAKTYFFDNVVFGAAPLPVKLLSFTAVKKDKSVLLNWQTATETNNRGFAVERSRDGQIWSEFNFVKATASNGAGSQYATTDATPAKGMNYYRLKQMDLDGKETYSAVKAVNFGDIASGILMYPNPAKGRLNLYAPELKTKAMYSLVNVDGKVLKTGVIAVDNSVLSIDVSTLPAGTYLMKFTGEGVNSSSKLVIY